MSRRAAASGELLKLRANRKIICGHYVFRDRTRVKDLSHEQNSARRPRKSCVFEIAEHFRKIGGSDTAT